MPQLWNNKILELPKNAGSKKQPSWEKESARRRGETKTKKLRSENYSIALKLWPLRFAFVRVRVCVSVSVCWACLRFGPAKTTKRKQ